LLFKDKKNEIINSPSTKLYISGLRKFDILYLKMLYIRCVNETLAATLSATVLQKNLI